jgi:hypothetical protein
MSHNHDLIAPQHVSGSLLWLLHLCAPVPAPRPPPSSLQTPPPASLPPTHTHVLERQPPLASAWALS